MARKAKVVANRGSTKSKLKGQRGKGMQSEAAVHKGHKSSKVASRRIGGAQRSAQRRQQKKRDSR